MNQKKRKHTRAQEVNRVLNPRYNPIVMLQDFIKMEAAGGLILVLCATIAMIIANSPLSGMYHTLLHETKAVVGVGPLVIEKDIIHWINDGLMAMFFFLVGLEIKREIMEGMLSTREQLILPIIAAVGGMAAPGVIFFLMNNGVDGGATMAGWAIPTATDIAFAIGVLSLLGRRVPISLKIFLLALAIIDDLGAIVIIAVFYTSHLEMMTLAWAGFFVGCLIMLNRMGVNKGSMYLLFGVALWVCVLKSGIHATLAGVITAFMIPLQAKGERRSLLRQLEHDLNSFIAFFVMPVFALANAGVNLEGVKVEHLAQPVTLGVILGLLLGKPIGITLFTWIFTKLKLAKLPDSMTMKDVLAVSLLGGIGFTMSIFIATLGFSGGHTQDVAVHVSEHLSIYLKEAKLGILIGSVFSASLGLLMLWMLYGKRDKIDAHAEAEEHNPCK